MKWKSPNLQQVNATLIFMMICENMIEIGTTILKFRRGKGDTQSVKVGRPVSLPCSFVRKQARIFVPPGIAE